MPETEASNQRPALSATRIVFLGICLVLGGVINGVNYTGINVCLEGISQSLKVKDGALQWAANSYLLAFVSIHNPLAPRY
jgi:hypothetical protein